MSYDDIEIFITIEVCIAQVVYHLCNGTFVKTWLIRILSNSQFICLLGDSTYCGNDKPDKKPHPGVCTFGVWRPGRRGVVADHFNQDSWRCDLTPKYQLSMFVSCNLHVMTKPAANFTPLLRPIGEISVIDRKNMNHWRSAHLFVAPYIESPWIKVEKSVAQALLDI